MAYYRFIVFTCFLAFTVIVLGAYTRLGDAGLGCPDWPGCYGQMTVPESPDQVVEKTYLEQRALEPEKGWKEMIHRYFAGILGLAILVIAIWSWKRRGRFADQPVWLPTFLLALVIFQAALGMRTVTLLLKPVVVMGHLLGGFATLALLFLRALRTSERRRMRGGGQLRLAGAVGILILVAQIALGGWTSSNYAALACLDFPTCQGQWWPNTDFGEGFVLWREIGVDYEGGILDLPARTAIHMAHRIGAVVTLILLGVLALRLLRLPDCRKAGTLLGVLLLAQVTLGILNIVLYLPLTNAVAHNATGALLFAVMLWLLQRSGPRSD